MNQRHEVKELCNGNYDLPLKIRVFSWRNSGYHKFYGEFQTSISQIANGVIDYNLFKDDQIVPGSIFKFEGFYIQERPSFFDCLRKGWKLNMILAVDFTASNGEISDPHSLHHLNSNGYLNDYQCAIKQVGSVLEPYSENKMYPCFGFGGIPRYAGMNQVSHCFNLNGSESPEVQGVQGILEAYQFSLLQCGLYGPTMFSPCLRNTVDMIKERLDQRIYHIYVILTDGDIHDMPLTKDIIVEGSEYPLSIIIIGLGENQFDRMIELDGDDVPYSTLSSPPPKRPLLCQTRRGGLDKDDRNRIRIVGSCSINAVKTHNGLYIP